MLLLLVFVCSASAADWGAQFRAIPSAARAIENEAIYTSQPHVAGTDGDRWMAEFTLQRFKDAGLDNAHIDEHDVYLTYPLSASLSMSSPIVYNATLTEPYIPEDPTSGDSRIIFPFNAYSASGIVQAPMVYVNYGRPEDYVALARAGVSAQNKIVLVRYGMLFRGLKARIAQENGAIGVVIYSDPQDDGFKQGPVFPDGPWRPLGSVQRGSAQFLSICPGDPRTPECGGTLADHIPSVPVQPISYGEASHFLVNLGGPVAPASFQGGLPLQYTLGGANMVTLNVQANATVTPVWNVCGDITGKSQDFVLHGNHRDAWVFGASDPNSGSSVLLEIARAFGELKKQGFVPDRTIRLCSWDAEEYGLVGSTAYAMANKQELLDHCVAYLNSDVGVGGIHMNAGASPLLTSLMERAASFIQDPTYNVPLNQVFKFKAAPRGDLQVLGSGSDYTSFIDHLGIPSMDYGFVDLQVYGVYHSAYDDFYWMNHFGSDNRTYVYYPLLAQFTGTMLIDLSSNSTFLDLSSVSKALGDYLNITQTLPNASAVDFSALEAAISAFQSAASVANPSKSLTLERLFLSENGLPLRPFYRHLIQAPGINLGYGSQIFPGVTQAIIDGNWTQAAEQVSLLAGVIGNAASFLQNK